MDVALTVFLIICVIVIIVVVSLIFLLRHKITKTGPELAKSSASDQDSKGFGTYKTAYASSCITADGKCARPGIQWVTEYCQPHPTTGYGCLDENGEQTFAPRSTSSSCQANCRSYVLSEIQNLQTTCNYDYPYSLPAYNCITSNVKAGTYRTFECLKNDPIGSNNCTYACSSSGKDSAGILGDTDSSKLSYIPACQNNPKDTIKLISLPWNSINNLPSTGVLMSKGYLIRNSILPNGSVDPSTFLINPAYPPWSSNPSNTISYNDLFYLDNNITIYENCIIDQELEKPECDNYYLYTPIDEEGNLTNYPKPGLCSLKNAQYPIKNCFYNPWYSLVGEGSGGTGLLFNNPYVGSSGNIGSSGAYTWTNIGNMGYIDLPMNCMKTAKSAEPDPLIPNRYIIPDTPEDGAICLNLTAPPRQCSLNFTSIFAVPNSVSLTRDLQLEVGGFLGACGITNPYNTSTLTTYPQATGTANFICTSVAPDGTIATGTDGLSVPGCTETCQYKPDSEDINFYSKDSYGGNLHPDFFPLIGKYVTFGYLDGSSNNYFLTSQNILCGQTGYFDNCRKNPNYDPVELIYTYDGGGGITGGNFWSKNGCDSQSIIWTTGMQLLFSPRFAINDDSTNYYAFACDIYARVGGISGYLAITDGINPADLPNLFYGSNIIANTNSTSKISFIPFSQGTQIPRTTQYSGGDPFFVVSVQPGSTPTYTLTGYSGATLEVSLYDGTIIPSITSFDFVSSANKASGLSYFDTTDYNPEYIKTDGIYVGKNVSKTIKLQQQNQCYTLTTCQKPGSTGICYPNTCNLFYEYIPEYCS